MHLTKLTLTTDDGALIELSPEDARALYAQLHELFGAKYLPPAPITVQCPNRYLPWNSPNTFGGGGGGIAF